MPLVLYESTFIFSLTNNFTTKCLFRERCNTASIQYAMRAVNCCVLLMCLQLALNGLETRVQVDTLSGIVDLHLVASQFFLLLCQTLPAHIQSHHQQELINMFIPLHQYCQHYRLGFQTDHLLHCVHHSFMCCTHGQY